MLSSEVIGKVAEVFVEEGDRVKAGQLVLRVDDRNFLAGLEQAEASVRLNTIDIERQEVRIDNLERQFARTSSLFERDLVGEEEFDLMRQPARAGADRPQILPRNGWPRPKRNSNRSTTN